MSADDSPIADTQPVDAVPTGADSSMEAAAAEPASAAASSSDAAAEPAAASSSSAAAASASSLSDLMNDETDELAEEAMAAANAEIDRAAAAADVAAQADEDVEPAGDTAMDDTAAAAAAEGEGDEGDDSSASLESQMLSHCRLILASLSLAQVQKSSKSHMLDKLKGIMGKKIIKRNKELATKVARQAASERLAELEKGGEDDTAAAAAAAEAEEDARPLAEYQDEDEDEEEEAPAKKKSGKKRLRKNAGSDAEDDPDDDGDYNEGAGSSSKSSKKSKKSKKASSSAAAASSSTVALLAFEAPKTPYQIFQSLERRSMKDEHPDATPSELSKLISDKWNDLDEDAKAEFEALALKQKTDHAADLQRLRDEDPVAYEKHMKAVRKREDEQLMGPGGKKKKGGGYNDEDAGAGGEDASPPVELSYFDSIIADLKPKKKTKKDYQSDDMIAQMAQKEQAFIDKMINVAKLDEAAAASGKPAVHKLKMLPDVQAQLSKREVADRMMDSGLLRALCLWIAPEADGSLPNVRLRTIIYQLLGTLRVTETSLASSQGLGKRVMRLWKDPHELLSNKKLLAALMEKWMRPMLGLSTDYEKAWELEEERAKDIFRRKAIIDAAPKAPNYNPKRARIPEPARFDYAIRPQAANERETHDEAIEADGGKQKKEETRKQQMSKRLDKMGKGGGIVKPKFKVDITGRASNL